jgi:hypothetical protein
MKVRTIPCPECGRQDVFDVTDFEIEKYRNGAHIQNAFPNLTADQREQLITGLDKECWDKVMGPEPTD